MKSMIEILALISVTVLCCMLIFKNAHKQIEEVKEIKLTCKQKKHKINLKNKMYICMEIENENRI